MMCAPLTSSADEPLGIIYVDASDPEAAFGQPDLETLSVMAAIVGRAVETAGEHQTAVGFSRIKLEMDSAKEVQLQFLPKQWPEVHGYEFYHYYQAAREIGGDYFGYLDLPDGRLAVAIGDVAGKGVSAALLMTHLCSEVRFCLSTSDSPAEALMRLNKHLSSGPTDFRFVTLALCVLDPREHKLTVVNAGHMAPLWRHAATGHIEALGQAESGMPLGCEPEKQFRQVDVQLQPGDTVLLYTDGISEAPNAAGELFGADGIRAALNAQRATLVRLGEDLIEEVRRFSASHAQQDDICLVGFSRVPLL